MLMPAEFPELVAARGSLTKSHLRTLNIVTQSSHNEASLLKKPVAHVSIWVLLLTFINFLYSVALCLRNDTLQKQLRFS